MGNSKTYNIRIKRSAQKEIKNISTLKDRQRVLDRILKLSLNPRPAGSKKLTNQETYRIRQGKFRILYTIKDDILIIEIIQVQHRKDVYT